MPFLLLVQLHLLFSLIALLPELQRLEFVSLGQVYPRNVVQQAFALTVASFVESNFRFLLD
jgi:hypothetical protein